jgi:hypothetical protein
MSHSSEPERVVPNQYHNPSSRSGPSGPHYNHVNSRPQGRPLQIASRTFSATSSESVDSVSEHLVVNGGVNGGVLNQRSVPVSVDTSWASKRKKSRIFFFSVDTSWASIKRKLQT